MHLFKQTKRPESASIQGFQSFKQKSVQKSKAVLKPCNSKAEKQKTKIDDTKKSQYNNKNKNEKQSMGFIARTLSNTKMMINNFINPGNNIQNLKRHVIGEKYVYFEDDLIGQGFSSKVYKCADIKNTESKKYAIKILDLNKIKGFLLDLLKQQIDIHTKLNHENVVKCQDVIQTEDKIYLIQQYCSGGDLSTFINVRKQKVTEGEALNIMSQIVQGYKYLIKQNILHRDLKPCNIFKSGKDKKWKIGDFGFACRTFDKPDEINVGTPIYMPPEALQKSLYSHKSDFFSLGVIMFQLLHQKVPWFSKSESTLLKKMREIKLDLQNSKENTITSQLIKRFVLQCCQIQASNRISPQNFLKLELYPKDITKSIVNSKSVKFRSRDKTANKDPQQIQNNISRLLKFQKNSSNYISMSKSSTKNLLKKVQQQLIVPINVKQMKDKVIQGNSSTARSQTIARSTINIALNQQFKSNNQNLTKQIHFCKHLYYMIRNMNYFNLDEIKKQYLTIVIYKHIIFILKLIKDSKVSHPQLKKWELYKESKYYNIVQKQVTNDLELIEREYLKYLKKKDIRLLREINTKFPELSLDSITVNFYSNLSSWLRQLIFNFSFIPDDSISTKSSSKFSSRKSKKSKMSSKNLQNGFKKSLSKAQPLSSNIQNLNKQSQKSGLKTGEKIKKKVANQVQQPKVVIETVSQQSQPILQATEEVIEDVKISISTPQSVLHQSDEQTKTVHNDEKGPENNWQDFKQKFYAIKIDKISNATLQAFYSLLQYCNIINKSLKQSKDQNASFCLVSFNDSQKEENSLSLIREYNKVKFQETDAEKIRKTVELL